MTEDELVGWHYQLDGHEFEQASLIVQLVKNLPAMQEIPVSGRSAGEGIGYPLQYSWVFLVAQLVKRIHLQCRRAGFDPWVGKTPWRWVWQPTPVFLPGESPWREEPGRLQSMGSQRDRYN